MKPTKKRGFTLIEVMITTAVLTMVMGIAFTALRLNETMRDLVFVRIQLYRQNKAAHDIIREELQKSTSIRVTIAPNEIRFQIPLRLNPTDAGYETYDFPWGGRSRLGNHPGGFIRYYLNGTNLMREIWDSSGNPVAGTQEIKATDIRALEFTRVLGDANHIRITTTARRMTVPPSHAIEDSLESSVCLLN